MRARPFLVAAAGVLVAVLGIPAATARPLTGLRQGTGRHRHGRCRRIGRVQRQQGRHPDPQGRRQRNRRRGVRREHARRHRAVRGRSWRWRIHGHLPGQDPPGRHHRRTREVRRRLHLAVVHRPEHRQAAGVRGRPPLGPVGGRPGHGRHLGPRRAQLWQAQFRRRPRARNRRRPLRVHDHARLRPAGAGVVARPAGVHHQPRSVPHTGRRTAGGGLHAEESGSGPHVLRHRAQRRALPVRRTARQRHRADCAAPAGLARYAADGASRHHDRGRRPELHRPAAGADPRQLPRPGRLRHGAALEWRPDDRRGAEHPVGMGPLRRTARRRRCSSTSRRRGCPSPTGTPTSATRTTSRCRRRGCSTRSSPPPAAA